MGYRKRFFNHPPGDPTEPGPGQQANRSLRESHSAAQGISDFLGEWDQETIISKDGSKYNVLAQREGSDTAFWTPTTDFKKSQVKIAKGSITAPYDDRDVVTDDLTGLPHKENYHHFQPPETTLDLMTGEDNYYFIKAIFKRKITNITTASSNLIELTTSGPSGGTSHTHDVHWLYTVTNFYIEEVSDLTIVRFDTEDATADSLGNEDVVNGTGATVYQYLGHYNIDVNGKITDHAWRTGHTIDFRLPSYTALEDDTPEDP